MPNQGLCPHDLAVTREAKDLLGTVLHKEANCLMELCLNDYSIGTVALASHLSLLFSGIDKPFELRSGGTLLFP
jgi:hypothetical protein